MKSDDMVWNILKNIFSLLHGHTVCHIQPRGSYILKQFACELGILTWDKLLANCELKNLLHKQDVFIMQSLCCLNA